jgi:hypothetical protein
MWRTAFAVFLGWALAAGAAVVQEEMEIKGNYLRLMVDPAYGGAIQDFGLVAAPGNLAGGDGLMQEGFGVGSYYVPNRRLNEKWEVLEQYADRPVISYTYDCDGPNIRGLRVTRIMEPLPDESSVRVTWTVENKGEERQWVAPWVCNHVAPGGSATPQDRFDVPTTDGILQAGEALYYPAARNWVAATDPIEKSTWYAVFNADQTHSFLAVREDEGVKRGFQTAFVPKMLEPGAGWKTVYRMNVVRGLAHVDFACDELAGQLDYEPGKLVLLLAAVKPAPGLEIEGRVLASNGRVWKLPTKKFDISPTQLTRCTYSWSPPEDGAYDFMAQIVKDGKPLKLGQETASPHGGIDTQFIVGKPKVPKCGPDQKPGLCDRFEAWTDAPFALEQGPRKLKRTLAVSGPVTVWFEPGVEKVFPEDAPESAGPVDPTWRMAVAQGERESFQVVVRPAKQRPLERVRVTVNPLTCKATGKRIGPEDVAVYNVMYHPVRVPSHFEGATGLWPDALPPFQPFSVPGGEAAPVWFTVHARPGLPPGVYAGMIELSAADLDPVELWVEVRVFGFTLPATPYLKTDFGFWMDAAARGAEAGGGKPAPETLAAAYLGNALEHRVTLRDLTELPAETADYGAALKQYEAKLKRLQERGATTFAVPLSLLDAPEQLKQANDFVVQHKLQGRAFVHLSDGPQQPAWPRLLEIMQEWKNTAPDIPVLVTSHGLMPFIPEVLDWWGVHSQVLDTVNNRAVLGRIDSGQEVWWYVNHVPPRPYGNFFLDFAAIEHRILFWQTWALGIRGMHYWSVNFAEPGQNPWKSLLDATPVNGDGFLVYPGPEGPVNSIRWENIRDGIEDFDYLSMFAARRRNLLKLGGHGDLMKRVEAAYDLKALVPDLVSFSRDSQVLLKKRLELAGLIEEMDRALK